MKLQCQVEVVNRIHSCHNIRSSGKYLKSTLALGKEPKKEKEFFIIHFSSVNKTGVKYKVQYMKQVFVRCLNEGKATLRFEEPAHDLCIKSEPIQLKCFMKLLKQCVTGDTKDLQLSDLSNISVTSKDNAPTKLVIRDRSEFPTKGLPRTLESLTLAGLKLCNFRRDVLLLKQLTVLDLSNNEIEKIPPELGRMPSLAELYLGNNQLGAKEVDWRWMLGPQISNSLKLLDLTGNKLKRIPKAVWKLQRLVTLKLDNNELTELPSTLGRITSLRYLNISRNKLESLPCSLMQRRLEQIDISSNNFIFVSDRAHTCRHSMWQFCVGNLVQTASKVVLKHKIYYAPNIIPYTLVESLDNANMCICGAPSMNDIFSMRMLFDPKEFFRAVIADNNSTNMVKFDCFFCSHKCFNKLWHRKRYLTISKNILDYLPCGLMHSQLKVLDTSFNNFTYLKNIELTTSRNASWSFNIGSLIHIASQAVLKYNIDYNAAVIPHDLVELLDNAKTCICGGAVMNDFSMKTIFDSKDFFHTVFDSNNYSQVKFECFFCSSKCFNKFWYRKRTIDMLKK